MPVLLLSLLLLPFLLSSEEGDDRRWAMESCRSEEAMPSVTRPTSGLVRARVDDCSKGCRIIASGVNGCLLCCC